MGKNTLLMAAIAVVLADKFSSAKPLTKCAASHDGDCSHKQCPQLLDNEPHATGRHCPLDTCTDED